MFGKGKHLPLWLELFSVGRRGYKSQRAMVQMAIAPLVQHLGPLGLWLFDRGFDNWRFFQFLESLGLKVVIPQNGQTLRLIVAWGFGRQPLLLFANGSILDGACAVKLVRACLKRWEVEEAGRLIKQAFKLEDIRVLTWQGLVKLTWLAMWTYGLGSVHDNSTVPHLLDLPVSDGLV